MIVKKSRCDSGGMVALSGDLFGRQEELVA